MDVCVWGLDATLLFEGLGRLYSAVTVHRIKMRFDG